MKTTEPNWVIIGIAHSKGRADRTACVLEREGFICRLNPITRSSAPGEACFEIMALSSEAQEARALLYEHGL